MDWDRNVYCYIMSVAFENKHLKTQPKELKTKEITLLRARHSKSKIVSTARKNPNTVQDEHHRNLPSRYITDSSGYNETRPPIEDGTTWRTQLLQKCSICSWSQNGYRFKIFITTYCIRFQYNSRTCYNQVKVPETRIFTWKC